jgi:hypothetical protein
MTLVLTCYMTDKSRDFSTALRYARNDRTRDWNGNAYCAREKLANTTHLISMPEPYPCYPCNPWFVGDFEQIVASLAPKEPAK